MKYLHFALPDSIFRGSSNKKKSSAYRTDLDLPGQFPGGSRVASAGAVELLHWFLSAALLVRFFDTSVTLAL